jgi:hypothetical protein
MLPEKSSNKMKKFYLCLIVVILLTGAVTYTKYGDSEMNEQISDSDARKRIYEFLKSTGETRPEEEILPKLQASAPKQHPNLGHLYVYKGPFGEFWVSCNNGDIITYSVPNRFTATEAQEYAKAFLNEQIEDFDKRNFVQVDAEMDDPLWEEEWIEKPQRPKEVSIFQNWAVIQVHLDTRRVHYFNASNLRLVRTTQPKINEQTARQIILRQFPEGEILELELMEHTTDGGKSVITIWNASIKPDDEEDTPMELLSINADTGDVVP